MIEKFIPKNIKKVLTIIVKKRLGIREFDEIHTSLKNEFYESFKNERTRIEFAIPKIDLEYKHIANLKMLLNRSNLLQHLPKNSICAEIGVNEGDFSKEILLNTNPKKLHLIDAWEDESRYLKGLKRIVCEKFANEIEIGKVKVNVGFSTDLLKQYPNCYFDWVYLDTDHSYQTTFAELYILKDKIKPNGIICGHDYIIGNWLNNCRYGVIEAVHELCVNDDWEIIFLTINKNEMPSFAIRKIY